MSVGTADIGVVGLAVMGANIARNLAHKGYKVAVYNRTYARTEKLIEEHGDGGRSFPLKRSLTSLLPCQAPGRHHYRPGRCRNRCCHRSSG